MARVFRSTCLIMLLFTCGSVCGHDSVDQDLLDFNKRDCAIRHLAYEYALHLRPDLAPFSEVYDALRLYHLCAEPMPSAYARLKQRLPNTPLGASSARSEQQESRASTRRLLQEQQVIYADASLGLDTNAGSKDAPVKSLERAVQLSRALVGPRTVLLAQGTYYLSQTLVLTAADSNLTITSSPGATAVVSGGYELSGLQWQPYRGHPHIQVARLAPHHPTSFNSLYVGGKRAVRARWPNADPEVTGHHTLPSGYIETAARWLPPKPFTAAYEVQVETPVRSDHWFQKYQMCYGGAAAQFSPPRSYWACGTVQGGLASTYKVPTGVQYVPEHFSPNVANWSHPSTGVVHAFHGGYWGGWQFAIDSVDVASSTIHWSRGGFQEARGWDSGGEWYVENILEELDQPGEWFLDTHAGLLYMWPNSTAAAAAAAAGGTGAEAGTAAARPLVAGVHKSVVRLAGSQAAPVVGVSLLGLTFSHTGSTFMEEYEVTSGGDWSIHRGAALVVEGAEATTIAGCTFDSLGGNGLLVSRYARHTRIRGNQFRWIGDTAVLLVGSTQMLDATDGNHPVHTVIEGNIIREVGIFGKQTAGIFQSMATRTTIRRNVMFNGPRAGINFNDVLGGGHLVEHNLLFNWNRETFDHGPFNSWDRLPFILGKDPTPDPETNGTRYLLDPETSHISRNFLLCSYHSTWPSDHDDGSSYYHDSFNLNVYGGWKNYMGHSNAAYGNVYLLVDIGADDRRDLPRKTPFTGFDMPYCVHHPGVHKGLSGYDDVWRDNTCVMWKPLGGDLYDLDACDVDAGLKGMVPEMSGNRFYTRGVARVKCGWRVMNISQWGEQGYDVGSRALPLADLSIEKMVGMGRRVLLMRGGSSGGSGSGGGGDSVSSSSASSSR